MGKKPLYRPIPEGSAMYDFHLSAHEYFKSLVLSGNFACVGAISAVKSKKYAFCAYPDMTAPEIGEAVAHDILMYKKAFDVDHIMDKKGVSFVSFIAAFKEPVIPSQMDGVGALYTLLKNVHAADASHFGWATSASPDPKDKTFAYSVGGDAYFLPFMYKQSGSPARQSEIPMVVFNIHTVFAKLREVGAFESLKQMIHDRQSWVHPNLADHGDNPEFVQYALVDPDDASQAKEQEIREEILGTCPFG